jgi:hypothetical protein
MSLKIEPIRRLTTDETGTPTAAFAVEPLTREQVEAMLAGDQPLVFYEAVDVSVDERGRPLSMTHHGGTRERVSASVEVAVRQRRIPASRASHFLGLGERDPDGTIDALVRIPPNTVGPDYAEYAAATGVHEIARPIVPAGDEHYVAFAASTGIAPSGTLPPSVTEARR